MMWFAIWGCIIMGVTNGCWYCMAGLGAGMGAAKGMGAGVGAADGTGVGVAICG